MVTGGCRVVPARSYEFIASLQMGGASHFCGGQLISPRWVLTAAHCIGNGGFTVKMGLDDLWAPDSCVHNHQVARTIVHPEYDPYTLFNDVALIELKEPSVYEPIDVYNLKRFVPSTLDQPGVRMRIAGWGGTFEGARSSQTLQHLHPDRGIPITTQAYCMDAYPNSITDRQLCAGNNWGGKDACQGDSGGPLFVHNEATGRNILMGVVSWGEGCGRAGKPGVYARVSSYVDFICTHTGAPTACYSANAPRPPPLPPSPPAPPMFPKSVITLNFNPDLYPSEVSWKLLVDGQASYVGSGNSGGDFEVRDTNAQGEKACYQLLVIDTEGDGICCRFGNGSFSVSLHGEEKVVSDFTESQMVGGVNGMLLTINPEDCTVSPPSPPWPPLPTQPPGAPPPPAAKKLQPNWKQLQTLDDRGAAESKFDYEQRCSYTCMQRSECVGFLNVFDATTAENLECDAGGCCVLYKMSLKNEEGFAEDDFFTVYPLTRPNFGKDERVPSETYIRYTFPEKRDGRIGGDDGPSDGEGDKPTPRHTDRNGDDGETSMKTGLFAMTIILVFLAAALLGAVTHALYLRTRKPVLDMVSMSWPRTADPEDGAGGTVPVKHSKSTETYTMVDMADVSSSAEFPASSHDQPRAQTTTTTKV